jgi:localization factor PodJL
MPLRDEQAISAEAIEAEDGHVNVPAEDMQAILKLVAMQLEGADRRHAEALGQMYERLQVICNDARLTQEKVPAEVAPALERLQEGIEQLAELMVRDEPATGEVAQPASPEHNQHDAAQLLEEELPAGGDEFPNIIGDPSATEPEQHHNVLISDLFPAPEPDFGQDEISAEESVDNMAITDSVFTDNAADQVDLSSHDQQEDTCEPSQVSVMDNDPVMAIANAEPANEDLPEPTAPESVAGDMDQPWDLESAEALTRIYESGETGFAAHPRLVPGMLPGMLPDVSEIDAMAPAPRMERDELVAFEPAPEANEQSEESHSPDPEPGAAAYADPGTSSAVQPIDQDWLEERFAEIAVKIEEAMLVLREDEALEDLSCRFGEFEQRVGDALEDVATRQDIDALKVAESQIDSMLGYFERVEAQLGRIDSLEGQLESIIERISDDQLTQNFAQQRETAQADYAEIAETVAQSVAKRFLADNGGEGEGAAVSEIRESLEAFMAERREHDAESASMLDTVQQALIRVLDRVEAMESGQLGSHEMAPQGFEAADLPQEQMARIFEADTFDEQEAEKNSRPEASDAQVASEGFQRPLEYPAAVMGLSDSDEAAPYRQAAGQLNGADQQTPSQSVEIGAKPAFSDLAAAQADLAADLDPAGQAPMGLAPAADAGELPAASPIDRLRQEFIADAKRARQNATEQASKGELDKPESASLMSKLSIPKLPSLGISFGASKSEVQTGEIEQEAAVHAPIIDEEAATQTSRFALTRSRILVGAVIVLFATAGALMMMRGKPKTDVIAPPAQIEQPFDNGATSPELFEPLQSAPVEGGQQGNLEGGRIYDGEFNYDVAPGLTGKPLASAPAGFALTDSSKPASPEELAKVHRRRAMAQMSSDLGAAAAYATPASLMPDYPSAQTEDLKTGSVAQAGKGNQLELPPAVVGPLSLRLAAAKGDPSAQFEVAARLAAGTGSARDLKGAVHWYKLSAAQGFPQAQYRLGTFYERGVGVDKDLARAKIWYKRAADKGNVKAMHNLAVVTAGRDGGQPDYTGAAKWFEKAAQRGLSDSQYNMAVLHESGLGVKKDLKSAYYYYALAAAAGDQQAAERSTAVRVKLSPSEITTADRQIKLFRPKLTDRIANDARAAGNDWKKRADHSY